MLWLLNQIRKLLIAIHSKQSPSQLALGLVFGFVLGLLPKSGLFFIGLFLLFFFNLNIALALFSLFVFSLVGALFDSLFDTVGAAILEASFLYSMWDYLYHVPLVRLTDFNNTIVMGTAVIGLVLALPLFFLSRFALIRYRKAMTAFIEKHPVMIKFKKLKWVLVISRFMGRGQ